METLVKNDIKSLEAKEQRLFHDAIEKAKAIPNRSEDQFDHVHAVAKKLYNVVTALDGQAYDKIKDDIQVEKAENDGDSYALGSLYHRANVVLEAISGADDKLGDTIEAMRRTLPKRARKIDGKKLEALVAVARADANVKANEKKLKLKLDGDDNVDLDRCMSVISFLKSGIQNPWKHDEHLDEFIKRYYDGDQKKALKSLEKCSKWVKSLYHVHLDAIPVAIGRIGMLKAVFWCGHERAQQCGLSFSSQSFQIWFTILSDLKWY